MSRRIPTNDRILFDNTHDRDSLRSAYKALVAELPHAARAIHGEMATCKGLNNRKVAARLETVAYTYFGSTAKAAAWVRTWKIQSFQSVVF